MLGISKVFYRIFLKLYYTGVLCFALFDAKAAKWIAGQKNAWNELNGFEKNDQTIWVHCASLGEFEQAKPVIESLKTKYPAKEIIITFFSPSGYEILKKKIPEYNIFYLPFDSPDNAVRFVKHIDPCLAIFVKYDLWYYYLNALKQNKIPAILISAVFKPKAVFFKWYGILFREMLKSFKQIFVQDVSSFELLNAQGYTQVTLSGDTRVDRVIDIQANKKNFPWVDEFTGDNKVFIAGSVEPGDESLIIRLIHEFANSDYKFILAPHDIEAGHVQQLVQKIKKTVVVYSKGEDDLSRFDVMIIDNIGMLSSLYHYADIAYIGGGFDNGLHNILEPAVYGVPIIFGPQLEKFREAIDLVGMEGAFAINNYNELQQVFSTLSGNSIYHAQVGKTCGNYILKNAGATKHIMKSIVPLMDVKP